MKSTRWVQDKKPLNKLNNTTKMKSIIELEKKTRGNKDLQELGMEIAQYFFTKTQENLVEPMPWGDDTYSSRRKATVISDQGLLLQSGVPPYWEDDKTIVFRYDASHAPHVEWGSPPHAVAASKLVGWAKRKLSLKGKTAQNAAFAIATKIRKEGIDPHPFVRPAAKQTEKHFKFIRIKIE